MAIPTIAECYDLARAHLSDQDVEIFLDGNLAPFFGQAYRKLWDAILNEGLPIPEREWYYILPAYTNILSVNSPLLGIDNFGDLVAEDGLSERASAATVAITGASNATPIEITATAHGLATNSEVIVAQVGGQLAANGRWFITVTGANTFTLNGSVDSGGVYTSGGVVAASSADLFRPMTEVTGIPQRPVNTELGVFQFSGDAFLFVGATTARQLRIRFTLSGAVPSSTSASVGIDNSKNFFATYTAALAGPTKGMIADGERLSNIAGSLLEDLLNPMRRAAQRLPSQRPRFRAHRHSSDYFVPA